MDVILGTRFYHVSKKGAIHPNVVLVLPFESLQDTFFDCSEAIELAKRRLPQAISETDSISTRRDLERYLENLQGDPAGTIETLESAAVPFETQSLQRHVFGSPDKSEAVDVAKIPPVEEYFVPGTIVYVPITPLTGHIMSGGGLSDLYFVMKTKVNRVSWQRGGRLWHSLDSGYNIHGSGKNLFKSHVSALDALCELIRKQVPAEPVRERIKLYTWLDEQTRKEEVLKRITSARI